MREPSYRDQCEARRLEKLLEKEGLADDGRRCRACEGRGFNWRDGQPRQKRVTAKMIQNGHALEAHEIKSNQYRYPNLNASPHCVGIDWSKIGIFAIRRIRCQRCRGKGVISLSRAAKLLSMLRGNGDSP